jgi:hypothetical protein
MIPYRDVQKINSLINHPSIRERTLLGFDIDADLTSLIESGEAVFLGDEGGGFLVHSRGEGVWDVHTQFLPDTPKHDLMDRVCESLRYMFTRTDCMALTTFVEYGNKPALYLALRAGFKKVGEVEVLGRLGDLLIFTIKDWARSLCQ